MMEIQGKSIRVREGSSQLYILLKVEVSFIKFTPYYVFVFTQNVGDSFSEFFIYIYG